MKLPIRVRLTAAFAVTLAAVLAAVGAFVYVRFRANANRAINAELRVDPAPAVAFETVVELTTGHVVIR